MQAGAAAGGFVSFPEHLSAPKVRARSEKFFDHFSQATLFWNSQSDPEKDHLVEALRFELGNVKQPAIRERMVGILGFVDRTLASRVAEGLGLPGIPKVEAPINRSIPADGNPKDFESRKGKPSIARSKPLSMANTIKDTVVTRKVAILAADGVDGASVTGMIKALTAAGAQAKIIAPRLGALKLSGGGELPIDFSFLMAASVLFDAVYVPGGAKSVGALSPLRDVGDFVAEAYRHCKAIAATGEGVGIVRAVPGLESLDEKGKDAPEGIVVGGNDRAGQVARKFIEAIAQHRHWTRELKNRTVPPPDGDETRGRQAAKEPRRAKRA
ncbi:MAG: DJ-1/PfpI family protein [Acidobacteriota bacterium]|nr:DJ-1/PfpI family protein [Acidobacteriota bacterium]